MDDVTTETISNDELMTPEEMAMLKKLQEKRKAQQKAMSGIKEELFESLTESFAATILKAKKEVVTVSTGNQLDDGKVWAVTFGSDEEEDTELDTAGLARSIVENNLSTIEAIMGISNSMKVAGTYQGKKLFWQVRKR